MSSNRGAVITLQLGHYSNYVGSHYWNAQEEHFIYTQEEKKDKNPSSEFDNEIFFREGQTLDREVTFTPRLVFVDLKGSLGSLPRFGDLYHDQRAAAFTSNVDQEERLLWSGNSEVEKSEPIRKNNFLRDLDAYDKADEDKDICEHEDDEGEKPKQPQTDFYELDDKVSVWSDFLSTRYHPRSSVIVEDFQTENEAKPFDIFGLSDLVWKDSFGLGDQVEDSLRFFAEESDYLQGFNLLADTHDAFGGLAAKTVELMAEDYGSKSVLFCPITKCHFEVFSGQANSTRLVNQTLAVSKVSCLDGLNALTVPMSLAKDPFTLPGAVREFSSLRYDFKSMYHSSGVLGTALAALTSPLKLKGNSEMRLFDIVGSMNFKGRMIANAKIEFPFRSEESTFKERLSENDFESTRVELTPGVKETAPLSVLRQLRIFGGTDFVNWTSNQLPSTKEKEFAACDNVKSCYEWYCRSRYLNSEHNMVSTLRSRSKFSTSFPHIFKDSVTPTGDIRRNDYVRPKGTRVKEACTSVSVENSNGGFDYLEALASRSTKVNRGVLQRFFQAGLESDEWTEAVDNVKEVQENYLETDAI